MSARTDILERTEAVTLRAMVEAKCMHPQNSAISTIPNGRSKL
jgi:hypothetical protein